MTTGCHMPTSWPSYLLYSGPLSSCEGHMRRAIIWKIDHATLGFRLWELECFESAFNMSYKLAVWKKHELTGTLHTCSLVLVKLLIEFWVVNTWLLRSWKSVSLYCIEFNGFASDSSLRLFETRFSPESCVLWAIRGSSLAETENAQEEKISSDAGRSGQKICVGRM